MRRIWNTEFNFEDNSDSGITQYVIDDREFIDENLLLNTHDVHFKFQKCLDGISLSYIKNTDDIYEKSLLTGDGYSINNMYNEYNLIDKYLENLHRVDIAINIQDNDVDITKPHFKLDNIHLIPGHTILLFNHDNSVDDDIYFVSDNYFLEIADFLKDRESSDKAKFYIKLGTYKEKQFFLENESQIFTITGENKKFTENHSYLIKNRLNYDINNTGDTAKIIFTNYAVARFQQNNQAIYSPIIIDFPSLTEHNININYLNYDYNISDESILECSFTGDTSTNKTFEISNDGIYFDIDTTFFNSATTNDNILISIFDSSGATIPSGLTIPAFLNIYTTIKELSASRIKIDDNIPLSIYNDLWISGYTYRVKNIHFSDTGLTSFIEYINVSPFSKILTASSLSGKLYLEIDSELKYIDYNLIRCDFSYSGGTTAYTFETDNQYSAYEYKPFIDNIFYPEQSPTNVYNENSLCDHEYFIEEIYDTSNNNQYIGGSWYPIQSSRYKITPQHKERLKNFKPYTFIDFGIIEKITETIDYEYYDRGDLLIDTVSYTRNKTPYEISDSGRTMITEIGDDYMIIEKCFNDTTISGFTGGVGTQSGITGIYDIINVTKISDIDDILMKSYLNIDDNYYHTKSDSERYRISGTYGQITTKNQIIRDNATGILYQDSNDKFNLDIFNINVDSEYNFEDKNLLYKPIELIDLGIDKKTKPATPIEINNLQIVDELNKWIITGSTLSSAINSSKIYDTIFIGEYIYSIGEWVDEFVFSGVTYSTLDNHDSTLDSNEMRSLMLLKIADGEILEFIPIHYEWEIKDSPGDDDYRLDTINLQKDNQDNLRILITHYDNRNKKKTTIVSHSISELMQDNNNGSDLIVFDLSANTMDMIQYTGNTTISFFNQVYDTDNNKYMLGRYYQETGDEIEVDSNILDTELNYVSLLTKSDSGGTMLWNRKIRHLTNPNATTGPLITELEIDEKDNLYLFGLSTNFNNYVEIEIGNETPINPIINKTSGEKWSIISKLNKDGLTLWNTIFKSPSTAIFTKPLIEYKDKFMFIVFNFSESITIGNETYTTISNQIINTVGCKVDYETGEVIHSKILKSTKYNSVSDITVDDDYIYFLGEFRGEANFDDVNIFSNGESGYILKIRSSDSVIINLMEIYSDDLLTLTSIENDSENIIVSGSWNGNIYINGFIRNTDNEEFFITNIKKNDL